MKVKIDLTIDIDAAAWEMNYGISGAKEIREDVREAVRYAVYAYLEQIGVSAA